jgi:flagellar biosynthesis/type III secretory pathway M-ring protein FliF/YscJ
MKYFVDILKQFTQTQRLIVLVLLLSFTTGSVLISQYLKTDDCRTLIDENLKMQEDFAKISSMLRAERMKPEAIMLDTVAIPTNEPKGGGVIMIEETNTMDEVLKIAESHTK